MVTSGEIIKTKHIEKYLNLIIKYFIHLLCGVQSHNWVAKELLL